MSVAVAADEMCFDTPMASSARKRVNQILARTTGYQLARRPVPVRQAKAAAPATKAGALERQSPAKVSLPTDFDDEMQAIVAAVQPYTMTSPDKLHAAITAARYIVQHNIQGDVVECGVWRGGTMHAIARTLDNRGDRSRDLWLYDTFEGMTRPSDADKRYDGTPAATRFESTDKWCYASLEDVQAGFKTVPYPESKIKYVKGPIEETVPNQLPETIAILRLDTDWYASTAHELAHMYDRLVHGGVLLIDDYGYWQGSRQATDEFLERTKERLLLIRTGSGRAAVKP